MKIALTGASGFIGKALHERLQQEGHEVLPLVREKTQKGVYWNAEQRVLNHASLEGIDAFIHLSGENIAERRWSEAQKKRILESRTQSTSFLSESLLKLQKPPGVFLSASACGYYGPDVYTPVDESAPAGQGFLAEVCQAWESAAKRTNLPYTRLVLTRFGVVLGPGGMLGKILPIFRLGLGAQLADGKQWMSWISREDLIRGLLFCLENPAATGAINFVSPTPCTNKDFTKALGSVLHRPTFGFVPRFALELAFGEMARETALASSRILPKRLLDLGFTFEDQDLSKVLERAVR